LQVKISLRTFLKYNFWGIIWGLLIILLTSIPGRVFPKLPKFIDLLQPDKLIHLFIFGIYVFLQIRGFSLQDAFPGVRKHAVLLALLIGLMLGAGTELLQEYAIPNRLCSVHDFTANVAGCFLGWWAARMLKNKN